MPLSEVRVQSLQSETEVYGCHI